MKEVIVERVVRVTEIIKLTDEEADIYEVQVKTVEDQREWARNAKAALDSDDIVCDKVKLTIRDIPDKPKKSRKKKEK